jgi:superfamily II DNA or RNA helicase
MALDVPGEYRLVDAAGQPADLNLMQRLTAYRLLHDKRVGNWSGVGAGKTNAAIFGAAVLDSEFTVILAANATIAGWKRSIERSFAPDSFHVHAGSPLAFRCQPGKKNFLAINYESFQQKWTAELLELLLSQVPIDFIVLDEVQFARQRHQSEARKSQRRQHVDDLIRRTLDQNSELRILAMSATPVVNNLREAVNVLTLLWPERDFSRIPVGVSIANAVNVHRHLREHGIRHVPRYEQQLVRQTVVIDGQAWLSRLEHLRPKDLLLMEQTLLEAKLQHVETWVRRGTLIYTQYIEEIVEPVKRAVEQLGLRIAAFTGKERISLEEFRQEFEAKRMDVLIGSAPIGTGVDGLQFLLDRLVFLTLPWSHADYEQIVGRLWRQGSKFHQIEVIIPQVTLREERAGQWSWDDLRLRCIEYKQTLADAALDGVIPRGGLPSQQELHRRSLNALKLWKENVSKGLPDSTGEA